jgi:hypothetical protein
LERLVNHGLIDEKRSRELFDDPQVRTIRVREHFTITDRGNQYLDVIQKLGIGAGLERVATRVGFDLTED